MHRSVRWQQFALLLFSLTLLAACGLLADPQFGANTPLEGEVVVTCSPACANRGQCGDSLDRGRFVFASQNGPVVSDHDIILPVDARATVLEPPRQETLEQVGDGQRLQIFFYHVQLVDQTQSGWVAGWCIADR